MQHCPLNETSYWGTTVRMIGPACLYVCLCLLIFHTRTLSLHPSRPNVCRGILAIYTQVHVRRLLMTMKWRWLSGPAGRLDNGGDQTTNCLSVAMRGTRLVV